MTTENDSERQARAQLASIAEMLMRLEHASECEGHMETCELIAGDISDVLGIVPREPVGQSVYDEYHDEDLAQQAIHEDALSVEVRTDWHAVDDEDDKPTEFRILLCTGGPAVQIVGTLNEYGEPESARIEHQDWGTPWTEYRTDGIESAVKEAEVLLTYARQFYFSD